MPYGRRLQRAISVLLRHQEIRYVLAKKASLGTAPTPSYTWEWKDEVGSTRLVAPIPPDPIRQPARAHPHSRTGKSNSSVPRRQLSVPRKPLPTSLE